MDDNCSHYLIKHIPLAFDTYISTIPHMYILHTTTELNDIIAIIFGTTKENLKITIAISYNRICSYSLSRNADEDANPLKLKSFFVFIVSFVPVMEYSDYKYIHMKYDNTKCK